MLVSCNVVVLVNLEEPLRTVVAVSLFLILCPSLCKEVLR